MKRFINNSCFLEAKLAFVELAYYRGIHCFPYRLSYIVVVLVATICVSRISLPFCSRTACLSVTSYASAYLDLCQRGNLLNKSVNHLEFTRNGVEQKQEAGNEC